MIACSTVQKQDIRSHYDLSTVFYRLLWGRHIHHGLWPAEELAAKRVATSPARAQQRLTETLAAEADIRRGEKVLDVGCGMGSSAIHLAAKLQCDVTGVTISSVQRRWAEWCARWHGVRNRTWFLCADAEQVAFPAEAFDVVWSIECTEHLFDKPRFFRHAKRWLKPGGRMAICAWLAGSGLDAKAQDLVHKVCEGFLCPSLGSREDYVRWTAEAGFKNVRYYDWTSAVERTWEICRNRVRRSGMCWLARDRSQFSPVLGSVRYDFAGVSDRSHAIRRVCVRKAVCE